MKETKELVPRDEYGIFAGTDGVVRTDSLYVAWVFEKRHANVIRDIETLCSPDSGLSREFSELNFELASYSDKQDKKRPYYLMTRDGFTILAMGYNGKAAMRFKE